MVWLGLGAVICETGISTAEADPAVAQITVKRQVRLKEYPFGRPSLSSFPFGQWPQGDVL